MVLSYIFSLALTTKIRRPRRSSCRWWSCHSPIALLTSNFLLCHTLPSSVMSNSMLVCQRDAPLLQFRVTEDKGEERHPIRVPGEAWAMVVPISGFITEGSMLDAILASDKALTMPVATKPISIKLGVASALALDSALRSFLSPSRDHVAVSVYSHKGLDGQVHPVALRLVWPKRAWCDLEELGATIAQVTAELVELEDVRLNPKIEMLTRTRLMKKVTQVAISLCSNPDAALMLLMGAVKNPDLPALLGSTAAERRLASQVLRLLCTVHKNNPVVMAGYWELILQKAGVGKPGAFFMLASLGGQHGECLAFRATQMDKAKMRAQGPKGADLTRDFHIHNLLSVESLNWEADNNDVRLLVEGISMLHAWCLPSGSTTRGLMTTMGAM